MLRQHESVRNGLKRLLRTRARHVAGLLAGSGGAPPDERIHALRQQLREVRALLRLVDCAPDAHAGAARRLRKTGRRLSRLRDAAVMVATAEALPAIKHGAGTASLLHSLQARRARLLLHEPLPAHCRRRLARDLQTVITQCRLERHARRGWRAIAPGLRKLYGSGRRHAARARRSGSEDAFHDCRKRTKDLFQALRFLEGMRPVSIRVTMARAHRLATLLGEEHDLAVLAQWLNRHGQAPQTERATARLLAQIGQRRRTLRRRALVAAERLYRLSPGAFIARLRGYWKQWRAV